MLEFSFPGHEIRGSDIIECNGEEEYKVLPLANREAAMGTDRIKLDKFSMNRGDRITLLAVERKGAWGAAIPVPGLAALNTGGNARVASVSCGAAGRCEVTGSYQDRHGHVQVFGASENNGVWGKAIPVPGLAALDSGGIATAEQVSCGSAGNCSAGGSYTDRSHHPQGFVVNERNGIWARAIPVPGLRALNKGGHAGVFSVSCPSRGRCAADGYYADRSGHHQGFVVTQDS